MSNTAKWMIFIAAVIGIVGAVVLFKPQTHQYR
jgi:hypothetical protein